MSVESAHSGHRERQSLGEIDSNVAASPESTAFIKKKLGGFIDDFKGKRNTSRAATNMMRAVSIIFGATVTILIGAKSAAGQASYAYALSVLTLALSASGTALNSWEAFSRHPGKWVRYRATLSMLYTINDQLLYKESRGPLLAKDVEECFNQIMLTVHEANQEWMNLRGPIIGVTPQNEQKVGH